MVIVFIEASQNFIFYFLRNNIKLFKLSAHMQKVLIWFLRPSDKLFISWDNPFFLVCIPRSRTPRRPPAPRCWWGGWCRPAPAASHAAPSCSRLSAPCQSVTFWYGSGSGFGSAPLTKASSPASPSCSPLSAPWQSISHILLRIRIRIRTSD